MDSPPSPDPCICTQGLRARIVRALLAVGPSLAGVVAFFVLAPSAGGVVGMIVLAVAGVLIVGVGVLIVAFPDTYHRMHKATERVPTDEELRDNRWPGWPRNHG